jgi:D-xylose 1-dehydrogenase (NADP+, D-xylono-1,5-lactone-forming)
MTNNSPTTLRWGIIGCGQIALDKSLPALLAVPEATLVAISDPLEARRTLARGIIGDQPIAEYADYLDLLADPNVDAVYIALPTGMHAPAVIAAAKAKKAILCEKPLGRSAEESRTMIQAATENGVALMTAYMSRFGDTYQKAKELLSDGAIGQVTFVYANFSYPALGPYPPGAPGGWRWTDPDGGGPLLDIGVYLAFGLREMLGDTITRVGGFSTDTVAPAGLANRDTTVAWFQTKNGIPGAFAATFAHAESRIIFYGTDGKLEISQCFQQNPTGHLICKGKQNVELITQTDESRPHFENYRREFSHFTNALLGNTPYSPSPTETLTDALLLDALKTGGEVNIPTAQEYLG